MTSYYLVWKSDKSPRCFRKVFKLLTLNLSLPSYSPPRLPFGQGFQRRACRV